MSEEVKIMNEEDTFGEVTKVYGKDAQGNTLAEVKLNTFTRPKERREKIFAFPEYMIMDALIAIYGSGMGPRYEIIMPDLPKGATVERIHHEPMNKQFLVAVSHPSFDVVPEGYPTPSAEPMQYMQNTTMITITRG